jgi:hypothetical protein
MATSPQFRVEGDAPPPDGLVGGRHVPTAGIANICEPIAEEPAHQPARRADGDRDTKLTKPYLLQPPEGSLRHYPEQPSPPSDPPFSDSQFGGGAEEQHSMKTRFVETTPAYMLCADELGTYSTRERKSRALSAKYVAPNSAGRIGWQFFDLDYSGAAEAFDDKNVAVPNVIVENPRNGHAHYGYALEVPVSNGMNSRRAPMVFLSLIRAGMTRRLGSDPNFRFGLNKNPLHQDWRTTWLSTHPYALNDMAVWLDDEEMQPIRHTRETEFAELGRNCSRPWALAAPPTTGARSSEHSDVEPRQIAHGTHRHHRTDRHRQARDALSRHPRRRSIDREQHQPRVRRLPRAARSGHHRHAAGLVRGQGMP